MLQEKLQSLLHCQERLRETAEVMKEKDREIDSLKTKLKVSLKNDYINVCCLVYIL